MGNNLDNVKIFDGIKTGKLGTKSNPATVTVQTKTRARELEAIFKAKDWAHTIIVDKDKEEDISELEMLENPVKTVVNKEKVGRNEKCPCGSGKKYKHCHGA